MAKALKCDKCGDFFDCYIMPPEYRVFCDNGNGTGYNKMLDLCPKCYDDLMIFLNLNRDEEDK